MNNKFSATIALGYAILFLMFFTSAIQFVGWVAEGGQEPLTFQLTFNVLLVLAGLFILANGEKIDGVLFTIIGAYWLSHGLRMLWFPTLPANKLASSYDGWFAIVVAIIVFGLWRNASGGHILHKLFLLGLWIAYLLAAIINWAPSHILGMILGYLVLVISIIAGLYSETLAKEKATT